MSNPGKTSADAPDRSYDSNDALESRFAPRNPQRFPGFRFAEVLLIGCTLDSGPRILESGAAGRRQMAAAAWRRAQRAAGPRAAGGGAT